MTEDKQNAAITDKGKHKWLWMWVVLGVLTLLLRTLAVGNPSIVESLYTRGFYQFFRMGIDPILALFPFPLIYLFFAWAGWRLWRVRKSWSGQPWSVRLLRLGAFWSGIVVVFFFSWGFNYLRLPLEELLGLSLQPLTTEELQEELTLETAELIRVRKAISGASSRALTRTDFPSALEATLRQDLRSWLQQHDLPAPGQVRGLLLYPRGIFLRFSTAGLYFPFTAEGHIDPGLHPVQWPSVMTHEMSHGFGFADEGTCNFLAYVALKDNANPALAYAGRLGYWRTLASRYRRQAKEEDYQTFWDALPAEIALDLAEIRKAMDRYPDLIPRLQYRVYDAYLKSQGIKEGMLNYDRVVMLANAWRVQKAGK